MTDNAIQTLDFSGLGAIAPAPASQVRMQLAKINLLQSTSAIVKDPTSGAKAGQFLISFDRDGITPPIFADYLRVIVLGWFNGRVMYPFDPENGKKKQGADVKPDCGSNNAKNPRMSERSDYVGRTFQDYRRDKDGEFTEWTITESCAECPLGRWMPDYEFDRKTGLVKIDEKTGKPKIKRGEDGKPLNAKPPCVLTTTYVVYLPDFGIPARLQVANTVATSIKKLADFFALNAAGQMPNVSGNQVKSVRLTPKLAAYRSNAESWSLDFGWDPEILSMEQALRWIELGRMYKDENIQEMLTGDGFGDEEPDESSVAATDEAPSNVEMATETAREKLGHGKSANRRMGSKPAAGVDTANPFSDED